MSFLKGAVKSLVTFFIVEMFVVIIAFVIIGPADAAGVNHPLTLISQACASINITPNDLAVGLVVIITIVNFIILFIAFIRR